MKSLFALPVLALATVAFAQAPSAPSMDKSNSAMDKSAMEKSAPADATTGKPAKHKGHMKHKKTTTETKSEDKAM